MDRVSRSTNHSRATLRGKSRSAHDATALHVVSESSQGLQWRQEQLRGCLTANGSGSSDLLRIAQDAG